MKKFGGMDRPERFAAATGSVAPLPIPIPLQNVVVDDRRLLTVPWVSFFQWILNVGTRTYLEGTHTDRISDKYDPAGFRPGTWFYETDRTVLYQVRIISGEPQWVYVAGTMRNTLANKPTDLGTYDQGFLFNATDYAHTWRWTGSTWEYAPGDRASGEIAWFTADPGTGWKLCDGSTTTRTTATAGTASFSTPNLIGVYAKGGATYTGGVVPATGGTLTGTTDNEASHTHGVSLTSGVGNAGWDIADTGTGTGVAKDVHAHVVTGNTGMGTPHSHPLTSASVTAGEPAHVDLLPYFRR